MSSASARREIAPTDYNFRFRDCLIGAQMLFVAFGALVLVPILTGLDSNVALFTAGVGTLLFQVCTRGKVPIFLASSFAFIAPIIYGVQTWGMAQTLGGLVCSGLVYFLLSGLIRWRGTDVVLRVLPPIVTGPVIMVIGLILAPVAVHMALGKTGDGAVVLVPENTALWISMTSLAVTVLVSVSPGRSRSDACPKIPSFSNSRCRAIRRPSLGYGRLVTCLVTNLTYGWVTVLLLVAGVTKYNALK